VRSRMALWYVLVLGFLLLAYAAGTSAYLFHSLGEQLDDNLLEDAETVEGLLRVTPDGSVALESGHAEGHEPYAERFVEVWSPESTLLYRSPSLRGQALGEPPRPRQSETAPSSLRLSDGMRVRLAVTTPVVGSRRVFLRVAHSEEALWQEMEEF